MNGWIRMGLFSAAAAALAGAGAGACVSGDLPAQQQGAPDGSSSGDGAAAGDGAATGDASGSGGGSSSTGSSSGGSSGAGSSSGGSSGAGSSSGGSSDAGSSSDGSSDAGSSSGGSSGSGSSSGGKADAGSSSDASAADSSSIATPDGAVGAANGCVKALGLWYVVRNDGEVLVENQDTTKEPAILGADGKPLTSAVAATGGTYHGCALFADNTVWCWREVAAGGNRYGQLGNGTTDTDGTAPVEVASQVLVAAGTPLTNVQALTRGADDQEQTCAITNDGKLYCWGDLTWLVNKGTALASPYAQAITTDGITALAGVIQASISPYLACALVKGSPNNSLFCWGGNGEDDLATGDTNTRQYPTQVTSLTSPTLVSVIGYDYFVGGGTVCVIDGEQVLCWGWNGTGATGTGQTQDVHTPSPVVLADGTTKLPKPVDLMSVPGATFCSLEPNQTIWCWGNGYQSTASNYGLTNVSILGGFFQVNAYGAEPLFLTSDGMYHFGMEWSRSPNCTQ